MIIKISDYIIKHFFLFVTIIYIGTHIFNGIGFLLHLFGGCTIILFLTKYKMVLRNKFDFLFLVLLLIFPFTWLINDYGSADKGMLIFRCILTQFSYMLFYYIGRRTCGYPMLEGKNINTPLLFCCFVGLYCYFFQPSWYMSFIYERLDEIGSWNLLELSRFRSLFMSPYNMSYICSIMSSYILLKTNDFNCNKHINLYFLFLFFTVMLLCMQRSPILGLIVSVFIYFIKYAYYHNILSTFLYIVLGIFSIYILILTITHFMDLSSLDFLVKKFDEVQNSGDEMVSYRLTIVEKEFSIIGDGVGRHAMNAMKYGEPTEIRDSEYLRMIIEQGYIGVFLFSILMIMSLSKCLMNIDGLSFELSILLFFLISMIGANPLSVDDKYGFIFWYVIGKISTYKKCNIAQVELCKR